MLNTAKSFLAQCLTEVVPGSRQNLAARLREIVRHGLAPVLIKPGTKEPLCPLRARTVQQADKRAKEEARERGVKNWDRVKHDCGIHHAITNLVQVTKYLDYMDQVYGPDTLNIGLEVGRSHVLVVDVDTATERDAFIADWSAATNSDESWRIPTVLSPGVYHTESDEWKHKDGGHYWFTLPEGFEFPDGGTGAYKAPTGWSAFYRNRQVLIPPSSRPEGDYRTQGEVIEAPQWLLDAILGEATKRQERAARRLTSSEPSDIDEWAATLSWDVILEEDGWHNTGLIDNCSCPVWTAPGSHASPKSATAHDLGCAKYDDTSGHCPLHIWTDNPPEWLVGAGSGDGKTLTKLQYIAARDYGNNISTAMRELGIFRMRDDAYVFDIAEFRPTPTFSINGHVNGHDLDISEPELSPLEIMRSKLLSHDQLDLLPKPKPLIEGFLNLDNLARLTGKSNDGKSFVALDMAGCIATGKPWHGHTVTQGNVLYLAAEGTGGLMARVSAWKDKHGAAIPEGALNFYPEDIQAMNAPAWGLFLELVQDLDLAFIVLDTQARITVGVDENSAQDMGVFVHRLDQLRKATKACVMVIHHLGHNGDQGRGSTAVYGALDSELRVSKAKSVISVVTSKQKDMEFAPTIRLQLVAHMDSAVLAGDEATSLWLDQEVTADSPQSDRIAAVIYRSFNPEVGGTRSEIRAAAIKHPSLAVSKTTFYRVFDGMISDEELDVKSHPRVAKTAKRYYPTEAVLRRIGVLE